MPASQDCIWLLLGHRGGDNAQVRAIAAHLELPLVEKQLTYTSLHMVPNQFIGASLRSLEPQARVKISPPWPKMVIAVGKRSVAVARFIKAQSGGTTRLVQLGRPRADLEFFDLVVTSPQYGLATGSRVLELSTPPSPLRHMDVAATLASQKPIWEQKNRPIVVLVAGGNSTTARFTGQAARSLARLAQQHTNDLKGSLFVLTSPRTPQIVVDMLGNELKPPAVFLPWHRPGDGQSNPYAAMLAVADEIIVTSDSASMIADGLACAQSIRVFKLPVGWRGRLAAGIFSVFGKFDRLAAGQDGLIPLIFAPWRELRRLGIVNPPRNMELLISRLIENDLARPFPDRQDDCDRAKENLTIPPSFDRAIARVAGLLSD